jgi:outer membrane protein OmpA-like peptidoglycan-associated protein
MAEDRATEDWAIDVRKYAPGADSAAIAGIVRHCGIALRSRDASLVSFSDSSETDRVRENFCRKKLALTDSTDVLDAAIAGIGARMKADRTKNRVTVYYLLAEHFDRLPMFIGKAAAAAAAAAGMAAERAAPAEQAAMPAATVAPAAMASADPVPAMPPAPVTPPVMMAATPAAAAMMAAAPAPAMAAAVAPASATHAVSAAPAPAPAPSHAPVSPQPPHDDAPGIGFALGTFAVLAVGIFGAAVAGTLIGSSASERAASATSAVAVVAEVAPAPPAAPPAATAPPAAEPVIPAGAGVIAQETEGRPMVSVYFDTAKTDIAADFAAAAAPVKAYLDGHPGARLAVSGFNDSRGNAAFNADLSKRRAQAVAAALAAIGVPTASIDLVKPADATDAAADQKQARRVEIMVTEAK